MRLRTVIDGFRQRVRTFVLGPEWQRGGILSDRQIEQRLDNGTLGISNLDREEQIQPASVDLTLGNEFVEYKNVGLERGEERLVSLSDKQDSDHRVKSEFESDQIILRPENFYLGTTNETINLPNDLGAEVFGRSSIGREGVIVETAGWGDPGFEGEITLEFVNHSPDPVVIDSGTRVCQLVFMQMGTMADEGYGEKSDAKYQGQSGATKSRIENELANL